MTAIQTPTQKTVIQHLKMKTMTHWAMQMRMMVRMMVLMMVLMMLLKDQIRNIRKISRDFSLLQEETPN